MNAPQRHPIQAATPYLYDPTSPATLAAIAEYGSRADYEHDETIQCECGCKRRFTDARAFRDDLREFDGVWIATDCEVEGPYSPAREYGTYHVVGGSVS